METTTENTAVRYPDAYNLGRAMSLIEGLLLYSDNLPTRELAREFLEEMREEKA